MVRTKEELGQWINSYVADNFKVVVKDDRVSLAELGIDSVQAVGLLCALEQWLGCSLPVDLLSQVQDLQGLVQKLVDMQSTGEGSEHPYCQFINPYLAEKLRQLKIDRTFVRGEGCYLYDSEGERYIDFMAQYGALPFGHHPQSIWDALISLREEEEPNFAQPSLLASASALARRLVQLAPAGLDYVTFANSGAEAVEAALKMARHATGRRGILSTFMGFHGKTFGALSATGKADYQSHFGLPLSGFEYIHYGNVAALEKALAEKPEHFAAFIVEPIQGEGGVVVPPQGYLRAVKEVCERFGVLLIVDEVQTGLGRTGDLFACHAEGVSPDIMTLSKALSGGLVPIGACLCSAKVYSEKFAMKHSSTFAGNALAARAGLATLDMLTRDNGALLQQVKQNGERLKARLDALRDKYPWLIKEICGRGYMLGIRFSSERIRSENFLGIASQEKELAQFVSSYLLNVERIRLAPTLNRGEVLRIQPPLIATQALCDEAVDAIERAISVVAECDTGVFYRAILLRQRPETFSSSSHPYQYGGTSTSDSPLEEAEGAEGESRFAFLMHPLDEQSYADYDASLRMLEPAELSEFSDSMNGLLDPVIGSSVSVISSSGARAVGDFIMIPHTAEQMRSLSQQEAIGIVKRGLQLAQKRGAKIVGLGAYSSVVTGGGAFVTDVGIPVTSGNSYTVVASVQAITEAISRSNVQWEDAPAAIVGAAGAIGACMAVMLSERVPRLILIGNPAHAVEYGRARLLDVVRRIVQHVLDQNRNGHACNAASFAAEVLRLRELHDGMEDVLRALERNGRLILTSHPASAGFAKVVVMATSFPGKVVDDDVFQRGAIVCDISRPRSVAASVSERRPDVLVIDGGVVAVPGNPYIGPYGLKKGTAYACMAETMLLTLDRHFKDTSIGNQLSVTEVLRQKNLAECHGFRIAELQSFGRPLTEKRWADYLQYCAGIENNNVRGVAA